MKKDLEMEMVKILFEDPTITILGRVEELTGEGGASNDDGWGHSTLDCH